MAGCDLVLPKGADGITYYVYCAYADDNIGTGFTTTFNASKEWDARLVVTTQIQTLVVGNFAGLWRNWKGATGAAGDTTSKPIATKTGDYTLIAGTDGTVIVDVANLSSTCAITLPDATACDEQMFTIATKNETAGTPYSVGLTSVSDIDGSASDFPIGFDYQFGYVFMTVTVQSDGTEWWVISRSVFDPRETYGAAVD